jgi:hypothetical protein
MTRAIPWVAGALAVAAVAAYWLWPTSTKEATVATPTSSLIPQRPTRPPIPGRDVPRSPPEPRPPPIDREALARTYREAVAAGEERPGEKAFRATTDAFVDYNMAFARAQAEAEGITVPEVRELTHFGLLVLETQRWPDVEEILGNSVDADTRAAAEALMREANTAFKDDMRRLVADGADEDARWALIRETEAEYRREYMQLTEMTPEMLDDLLAGDLTREGAPAVTPPPAPDEVGTNPDYRPPAERPANPR